MRTPLEVKLDHIVESLKDQGKVVVYSLARYDTGDDGKGHLSSTRISFPDQIDPDAVLCAILGEGEPWTDPAAGSLDKLLEDLRAAGWSVLFGYGSPLGSGSVIGTPVSTWKPVVNLPYAPCEHQRLDALRDVLVEWSNARHTSQLVWQD